MTALRKDREFIDRYKYMEALREKGLLRQQIDEALKRNEAYAEEQRLLKARKRKVKLL